MKRTGWKRLIDLWQETECLNVVSSGCKLETGSRQDKSQFTPFTSHFETGQNCKKRRQSWLVANSVHTANTSKTRQDSLVLSVSVVWT